MRSAKSSVVAFLLVGCATYAGGYTAYGVRSAIENVSGLKGERIVVVGVVDECWRLGCAITEISDGKEYRLGLGASDAFDEEMQDWLGRRVAVEADFTAECIDDPSDDVLTVCTDRATSLRNPRIIGSPKMLTGGIH